MQKEHDVDVKEGESGSKQKGKRGQAKQETKPKPSAGAKGKTAEKASEGKGSAAKVEVKKENGVQVKDEKGKREKPQYDMPGQTQPTPEAGEPLAKFYVSLLEQRPDSEMALKWCATRGLLSRERAEEWVLSNGKSTVKKAPSTPKSSQQRKSNPTTPAVNSTKAMGATPKTKQAAAKKTSGQPITKRGPKAVGKREPTKKRRKSEPVSESEDESGSSASEEKLPTSKRSRVDSSKGNRSPANRTAVRGNASRRKPAEVQESSDDLPIAQNGNKALGGPQSNSSHGMEEDYSDSDDMPIAQRSQAGRAKLSRQLG